MGKMSNKVLMTIAILVVSIVVFLYVIGTTGRDGAVAAGIDGMIGSVNANIAIVTGIEHLFPYINTERGAAGGDAQGDYGISDGADGSANSGLWN